MKVPSSINERRRTLSALIHTVAPQQIQSLTPIHALANQGALGFVKCWMMALTCPSLDLGKRGLEFASSSGCYLTRSLYGKSAPRSGIRTRRSGARCLVSAAPTMSVDIPVSGSVGTSSPISVSSLMETVAVDLQILNKNLKSIVGAENPVLISAADQIFGAGGKRMRPALVFLISRSTAELGGLKDLTVQHRRLAEIIEMIHTASLIHDDVLDESDIRRGKETIHQIFGTRTAVLAGDFMFAQSSWYLANLENIDVIKLISQVIKDFASGEIKQASSLFDCDLPLEEYLLKSYYKTASLIAASAKSAAIFSGASEAVCNEMFEYGKNLGLSFQIVDDILDFTQSAEQLGKPAGSDLGKGNLTAPVIFALQAEQELREIIDSEFSEPGSLNRAIEIVFKCGGIEQAQNLAREKANLAVKSLQCLPQNEFRSSLQGMLNYNLQRID